MKKTLIMILSLGIYFSILTADAYTGGSGTELDPYHISSITDLRELCQTSADWDKFFIQTADIEASVTQYWDDSDDDSDLNLYNDANDATSAGNNEGFSPIGNNDTYFSGSYDGQGYSIESLYINRLSNYTGLFGYVRGNSETDALVMNLGMLNVNITGKNYTGALSGQTGYYAAIENCYCKGTVTGTSNSGGLTGWLLYGTAKTSFADVTVTGTGYTGGLIGSVQGSDVLNCYSLGSVSKNMDHISSVTWLGGLAGDLNEATVLNSYSTGLIGAAAYMGGLVATASSETVTSSYWDTETSDQASSGAGTGKTNLEMKTQSTYTNNGWDFTDEGANGFDDIWSMSGTTNDGYPYLEGNQLPETPMPITLANFTALEKNGSAELTWETATETDNARFIIYRNGETIASISGAGTSSEPHNYSYCDVTVIPGLTYTYVLADLSYGNIETRYNDNAVSLTISSDIIEANFVMNAAYPNPFNPRTAINYQLFTPGHLNANIYNTQGQIIENLINSEMPSGHHQLIWNAANIPSGLYLLKMQSNGYIHSQKIVLMK